MVVSLEGVGPPSVVDDLFRIRTKHMFSSPWILGGTVSGSMFFLGFIGLILCCYLRRNLRKHNLEYLTQLISTNPDYLSQLEVYKADEWELSRDEIDLFEEIGRGSFGKVYRGHGRSVMSVCGEPIDECAVKMVTEPVNPMDQLHFLIEAGVMKKFNTSFIVKLYGVVSNGQPALLVLELMEKGNLRDYLRSRRPDNEDNVDHLPQPCMAELFLWAAQVADGMAYLESIKFCHRDLAARNCMVSQGNDVKIGDFGMSRDIYYREYYKPNGTRLTPIRWMPPEALKDGKFDSKSDIWSYGVVLYEMLTLAQIPYGGLDNSQVFDYVAANRQILQKPTDCPDFWYDLMVHCWKYCSKERPTFADIVDILLPKFHDESFLNLSYHVNRVDDEKRQSWPSAQDPTYSTTPDELDDSVQLQLSNPNTEQCSMLVCNYNRRDPLIGRSSREEGHSISSNGSREDDDTQRLYSFPETLSV